MAVMRARAEQRVEAHFNRLASANLHADQLALVRLVRDPSVASHPAEDREAERQKLIAAVQQAVSPAELDAVIQGATAGHDSTRGDSNA